MDISKCLNALILTAFVLHTCDGHLCLINPRQRGPMDISVSGSHTCFRHGAPCGGMEAETPSGEPFFAGQQTFIKWQQNFNHYEVGYPGFMDISIAPVNSEDFSLLAFVADPYVFAQDHQQNYTAVVEMPNTTCDHCVIRARYQSHKPGETTFYQCADVKIIRNIKVAEGSYASSQADPNLKTVYNAMSFQRKYPISIDSSDTSFNLQGLAYNHFEPDRLHFVNVSLDNGYIDPLNMLKLGIDYAVMNKKFNSKMFKANDLQVNNFLMDGIAALNPSESEMLTIYHDTGSMDDVASKVMVFFTNNGTVETTLPLQGFDRIPINALIYVQPRTYVSFSIQENPSKKGAFYFIMGQVKYVPGTGLVYLQIYKSLVTEDLFVNFQWASFDKTSGNLFVLMGNENEPDTLEARIYTYNFFNHSLINVVPVQKSICTFMSVHVFNPDPTSTLLYTIAPEGLYAEKRPGWSLIEINPVTGNVNPLFQIAPPGLFERYYGGTIINGLDQASGMLYHVLRVADTEADTIVSVDVRRKTARYSRLTNLRHIHNLSLSPK